MNRDIRNIIRKVDRSKLTNNTQRALLALLTSGNEWVARTNVRVPSATARIRDLRKDEFGGFVVECASANELAKRSRATSTSRQTFYRLNPTSVTVAKVAKVFEGGWSTTR